MTSTDNTSKRIEDYLEELLFGEHDDERKAIQEAKSLIMDLILEARIDEVKRPISEYQQAELEDKGRGYDFYFALRTRLDQLHNKKSPTITKKGE